MSVAKRSPQHFPKSQQKGQGRVRRWKWPRNKILNARMRGKQKEFALMLLVEETEYQCRAERMLLEGVGSGLFWLPL